jgi:hypothetical protein
VRKKIIASCIEAHRRSMVGIAALTPPYELSIPLPVSLPSSISTATLIATVPQ